MRNQYNLWENKSFFVGFTILLITFVGISETSIQKQKDGLELDVPQVTTFVESGSTEVESNLQEVFLPIVHRELPPEISEDNPIWAHASAPLKHEVVLFRHRISLDETLENAVLHIFADTRYEIWFDGKWIGRGPARFSLLTREYDVYQLGGLNQGEHLIAVLVQWAPNYRRSESTTPYLQAHIQGKNSNQTRIMARTGSQWKAYFADAWKSNASPVHSWGLIGPTELLDLRKLPAKWMQMGFNDVDWPSAVIKETTVQVDQLGIPRLDSILQPLSDLPPDLISGKTDVDLSQGVYRPRSIQPLDNVPMPIELLDRGLLSPGRYIGEITPESSNIVKFEASSSTPITVEVLSATYPSGMLLLDGFELDWAAAGSQRPDVYTATKNVSPGSHKLLFNPISETGTTFSLSSKNINTTDFPFLQGLHAGRRLLLAEPVADINSVKVDTDGKLDLNFNSIPSYAVLDLGRTVYGRLSTTVSGPAGAVIDIGWDERLLEGTLRPLPYPGSLHPQWNQTDSWVLDGTKRVISTIDARAGRYILIAAWHGGTIRLADVEVHEERYPLVQVGAFNSSDPTLDQIWQLGVNTLYANMSDAYSDPWRERGQWWGDAYVIEKTNQVVFGEGDLLKRGIMFMAEAFSDGRPNAMAPNGFGVHMLDYGMLWVHSLKEYVQQTGDTAILKDTYLNMISFLHFLQGYENGKTGLLDIPEGSWPQTTYIDSIGWDSRHGQSTAVNAMYYSTLLQAADIADINGDTSIADSWRNIAGEVKKAIHANLYLENEHRYVSSILEGEIVQPTTHAQAFALAYEVVPEDEIQLVAGSLLDMISFDPQSPEFEVYGTFWVLEALGKAGFIDEALQVIRTYHGHWLDLGASTTWEIYNANQFYNHSLSHGWGSSPTWFLSTYLLGAEQVGPNSWRITPSFGDFDILQGSISLADGELDVNWEKKACGDFSLEISSPENSSGSIWIDNLGRDYEFLLNDTLLWDGESSISVSITVDPHIIRIPIAGGNQRASFHRDC
jgi:alpha-L-rhamnosidase